MGIEKYVDWYVKRSVEINEYAGVASLFGWIGVYSVLYWIVGYVSRDVVNMIWLFSALGFVSSLAVYVRVRSRVLGRGTINYESIQIVLSNVWMSGGADARRSCFIFSLSRLMSAFFGGALGASVFFMVGNW